MDFPTIDVTVILRIDYSELYKTSKDSGQLLAKGPLSLLLCEEREWYILKINGFNYGLSRSTPILASSQEDSAVRAYVLPTRDGYFVIKIPTVDRPEILDNLEEILKYSAQFAYKEGIGRDALPVKIEGNRVRVRRILEEDRHEENKETLNVAELIYKGGKVARNIIVGSAKMISKGITGIGETIQNNYMSEQEQEEITIRPKTISKMAFINSATGMVVPSSTSYVKGIMEPGAWISKKIKALVEKKKAVKEATPIITYEEEKEERKIDGLGHAAVYSALTVWHGMSEALDIIRDGIAQTATNLVSHKYGPIAGEVFRAGITVAGGVAMPNLPALPGIRYLRN